MGTGLAYKLLRPTNRKNQFIVMCLKMAKVINHVCFETRLLNVIIGIYETFDIYGPCDFFLHY